MGSFTSSEMPAAVPSRARPTRQRYLVMTFLCVLSFLTYFDRVCIMRAQGDIQQDLRISDEGMGLIFGVFWFAYAVFEIPGGWMGDRYGARITMTRIVLAWSLFTFLSGSATGFLSLFLQCRQLPPALHRRGHLPEPRLERAPGVLRRCLPGRGRNVAVHYTGPDVL